MVGEQVRSHWRRPFQRWSTVSDIMTATPDSVNWVVDVVGRRVMSATSDRLPACSRSVDLGPWPLAVSNDGADRLVTHAIRCSERSHALTVRVTTNDLIMQNHGHSRTR